MVLSEVVATNLQKYEITLLKNYIVLLTSSLGGQPLGILVGWL